MNPQVVEFIGVWGFVISIIGFVITIILLAFNLFLIRGQLKVAKTQNETQIEIAKEQFKTQREIAERQFRIEVLSRNRQEWINKLREEIAQFQTALGNQYLLISNPQDHKHLDINERLVHFQKIDIPYQRLGLLLNPNEQLHANLDNATRQAMDCLIKFAKGALNENERETIKGTLYAIMDDISKHASLVLKSEWERVKRGE